jgi:putative ABC transport system ATP-binding protein
MNNLIEIKNITKKYKLGENTFNALDGVSLDIKEQEIIVILGPSGSGKTTMLNCLSGLDKVTTGKILYNGKDISKYSDRKMTKFRKDNLGFIFQTYNLLEHLNVYENVLVGAKLGRNKKGIDKILKTLELDRHKKKKMHELSGGEQQRISIARAIAKNPKVMFCDEPTGALDEKTGKKVLESLVEVNEVFKTTMIIVTHNPGIALIGDRVIKMNSGKIKEIIINNKRTNPNEIPWG